MSPNHATMSQKNVLISACWGGNLAQAHIQNSLGNSAVPDVSKNRRCILSNQVSGQSSAVAKMLARRRAEANTLLFGAAGHAHVLLIIEVNELSRTNLATRRMAPGSDYCCGTECSFLPCFIPNQQFQLCCHKTSTTCSRCSQARSIVLFSSIKNDIELRIETGTN